MCYSVFHGDDSWNAVEEVSEGIVLQAIDYRESSRILSLFTPQSGMMRLIVNRISPKKNHLLNLTTPLCRAEFIYLRKRSSLHRFVDGFPIDLYLPLRTSYPHLQIASKMLHAISQSQLLETPSSRLYQLLSLYLEKLAQFPHPETLYTSFQIKLFKHEGLLSITTLCNACKRRKASLLARGESACPQCAPIDAIAFTQGEWEALSQLFYSRSFQTPLSIPDNPPLQKKIERCLETLYPG